ncbi:MAG: diacylglycerol kinase family protein, partial [Candidatus Eremiobacterota bacterium]
FVNLGVDCDLYMTRGSGDAIRAAAAAVREGYDTVVAAGGDGTINEVVNGVARSGVALGIIPIGTENVFAKEMRIPLRIEHACRHVVTSRPRTMDLGQIDERYFLCFAGIGLDAQVVAEVSPEDKSLLGGLSYFLTGLRLAMKYRRLSMAARLWLDGEPQEHRFWLILVGNIASYGWQVRLTPLASPDDGLLDVCIFPHSDVAGIIRHLVGAVLGVHIQWPEISYRKFKELRIETEPPVKIQLDGDLAGTTPCTVRVAPGALVARF